MTEYVYVSVPFHPRDNGKGAGAECAAQLTALMGDKARLGWEFHSTATISVEVPPGCLGGLFGHASRHVVVNQVIFKRALSDPEA